MRVELEPPACFVGEDGRDVQEHASHDWMVTGFPENDVVTLQNVATGHGPTWEGPHLRFPVESDSH
jgi:hypothetical protein